MIHAFSRGGRCLTEDEPIPGRASRRETERLRLRIGPNRGTGAGRGYGFPPIRDRGLASAGSPHRCESPRPQRQRRRDLSAASFVNRGAGSFCNRPGNRAGATLFQTGRTSEERHASRPDSPWPVIRREAPEQTDQGPSWHSGTAAGQTTAAHDSSARRTLTRAEESLPGRCRHVNPRNAGRGGGLDWRSMWRGGSVQMTCSSGCHGCSPRAAFRLTSDRRTVRSSPPGSSVSGWAESA